MVRSVLGFTLVLVLITVLTSCPDNPGSPEFLGPYPVTGIDDNRFYRDINLDQERFLEIAPANPVYSDVSTYYESGLPSYLHLDSVTGRVYTTAAEITAVSTDASVDVDFWTDDSEGRVSPVKTITLSIELISS